MPPPSLITTDDVVAMLPRSNNRTHPHPLRYSRNVGIRAFQKIAPAKSSYSRRSTVLEHANVPYRLSQSAYSRAVRLFRHGRTKYVIIGDTQKSRVTVTFDTNVRARSCRHTSPLHGHQGP